MEFFMVDARVQNGEFVDRMTVDELVEMARAMGMPRLKKAWTDEQRMNLSLAFVLGRAGASSDPFDPRSRALFAFRTDPVGAQQFLAVARELGLANQAMDVIRSWGKPRAACAVA